MTKFVEMLKTKSEKTDVRGDPFTYLFLKHDLAL